MNKNQARQIQAAVLLTAVLLLVPATAFAKAPKGNWPSYAAKSFAGGTGHWKNPYKIATAGQLALMAKQVNDAMYKSKKKVPERFYVLTKDIDLSAHYWIPAGQVRGNNKPADLTKAGKHANLSLKGKGHTIKGLRLNKGEKWGGLFGVAGDTSVVDLKLKDVNINTDHYAGAVAGYGGYLFWVSVSGTVKAKKGAGGLIAKAEKKTVLWCVSAKVKVVSKGYAGGLVGESIGEVKKDKDGYFDDYYGFTHEIVTENIKATVKGGNCAGGLFGRLDVQGTDEYDPDVEFNPWEVFYFKKPPSVKVSGNNYVGGIAGRYDGFYLYNEGFYDEDWPDAYDEYQVYTLRNLHVKGSVKGKNYVGGLFGHMTVSEMHEPGVSFIGHSIRNSSFVGKVTGKTNTGGLIGYKVNTAKKPSGTITKCFVRANIKGGTNTGGFIGQADTAEDFLNINQSYYSGKISGGSNTGGMIGLANIDRAYFALNNSYVTGSVKGTTNTGGIAGNLRPQALRYAQISNSYISATLASSSASEGYLFGSPLFDWQTKLGNVYYNKTKTKTVPAGITVTDASLYPQPKATTTALLTRTRQPGLNSAVWTAKKTAKKKGYLPQLSAFAKAKKPFIKKASLKSVTTPAYYKVTCQGNGGKTSEGKTTVTVYLRYNAKFKRYKPFVFTRQGYTVAGISPKSPKKLPKILKDDKTVVKVRWKKIDEPAIDQVGFSAVRTTDRDASLLWSPALGASSYDIYRATSLAGPFTKIASTQATTFTLSDLLWDKAYYIRIYGSTTKGGISYVSKTSATLALPILKPAAQTAISTEVLENGQVKLYFEARTCHGYEFLRSDADPTTFLPTGPFSSVYDISADYFTGYDTSHIMASSLIGKPSTYRLRAYRNTETGKLYSDTSNTTYACSHPGKGVIISAEATTTAFAKLSYKNFYCTGYDLYKSTNTDTAFTKIKTILLNGSGDDKQLFEGDDPTYSVYLDTDVSSANTYYYKIVPFAFDFGIKAEGVASEIVSVVP
jgi:hypothetical protein